MTAPAARFQGEMTDTPTMELYVSGAVPTTLPTPAADRLGGQAWWETPYGNDRLRMERKAVREHFPGFLLTTSQEGQLLWVGSLESALPGGRQYCVTVTYPEHFPDEAPDVRIVDPEIPANVPHQLTPGRLCLYRSVNDPRYGYSPGSTTAATLVAWTALWIHAYETWQATRVWPGQED